MKKLNILLLVAVFSLNSFGQNNKETNATDYFEKVEFRIGTGVLIPQNGLKKYFGISPLIELSGVFPLKNKKSIALAIQFVIPNQEADFKYLRSNDTIRAKATFMFNPMIRFKRAVYENNKTQVNIGLGVGGSFINTNARNPNYEGKEDDTKKYEKINAILVTPGIEISHQFSSMDKISFSLNIQYSPYKVEGALRENIGSVFYAPKLTYKF